MRRHSHPCTPCKSYLVTLRWRASRPPSARDVPLRGQNGGLIEDGLAALLSAAAPAIDPRRTAPSCRHHADARRHEDARRRDRSSACRAILHSLAGPRPAACPDMRRDWAATSSRAPSGFDASNSQWRFHEPGGVSSMLTSMMVAATTESRRHRSRHLRVNASRAAMSTLRGAVRGRRGTRS